MNKGFYLFASVFQLLVGIAGIIFFAVLTSDGESPSKLIVALILSVALVVIGIKGITDYKKFNKKG